MKTNPLHDKSDINFSHAWQLQQFTSNEYSTNPVADLEGAQQRPPPSKIWSTMFSIIPFCMRMLKSKAQIAQESITKPKSFHKAFIRSTVAYLYQMWLISMQ